MARHPDAGSPTNIFSKPGGGTSMFYSYFNHATLEQRATMDSGTSLRRIASLRLTCKPVRGHPLQNRHKSSRHQHSYEKSTEQNFSSEYDSDPGPSTMISSARRGSGTLNVFLIPTAHPRSHLGISSSPGKSYNNIPTTIASPKVCRADSKQNESEDQMTGEFFLHVITGNLWADFCRPA